MCISILDESVLTRMDFDLTDEIEMLRTNVLAAATNVLAPGARLGESQGCWSDEKTKVLSGLGLSTLLIPATLGGDQDPLACSVALESLAAGDVGGLLYHDKPGPFSGALTVLGAVMLNDQDLPQTKSALAEIVSRWELDYPLGLIESESAIALAVVGYSCEDLKSIDSSEPISGSLAWSSGRVEDWISSTEDKSSLLFIVGEDFVSLLQAKELSVSPCIAGAFEASGGVSLYWQDLSKSIVVDASRQAAIYVRSVARLWVASVLIGIGQASLDYAIDYGRQRVVFGSAVVDHQANAFDLAEASVKLEAARLGLRLGCRNLEMKLDFAGEMSACWLLTQAYCEAREASLRATDLSLQLLGGHGYMKDHPVEKWWREARLLVRLFGGEDAALSDLSTMVLRYKDPLVL